MEKVKPLICSVCGDIARGLNFDVLTCMSCKAFFRRNALEKGKHLRCSMENDCEINRFSRGNCSACRLKKCFALGMNPQLIRSVSGPTKAISRRQRQTTSSTSQNKIVDVAADHRFTMTFDEWSLLSHILKAYDEQNLIQRANIALKRQLSLPPKLRSKKVSTIDFLATFYSSIRSFIENSPYFETLAPSIRRLIMENNLNGTGSLSLLYTAAQSKLFDNLSLIVTCNEFYGSDYVRENQRLLERMENNGTLIKLMLIILAFASNSSPLVYNQSAMPPINSSEWSSSSLLRIQNIFITMMWKYLIRQYGFHNSVKKFDHLVKNYLDILNRINNSHSRAHLEMLDVILNKPPNALIYRGSYFQ